MRLRYEGLMNWFVQMYDPVHIYQTRGEREVTDNEEDSPAIDPSSVPVGVHNASGRPSRIVSCRFCPSNSSHISPACARCSTCTSSSLGLAKKLDAACRDSSITVWQIPWFTICFRWKHTWQLRRFIGQDNGKAQILVRNKIVMRH